MDLKPITKAPRSANRDWLLKPGGRTAKRLRQFQCRVCRKWVSTHFKKTIFCSRLCYRIAITQPRALCANCSKRPVNKPNRTYCSFACFVEALRKHLALEAANAKTYRCEACGKLFTKRDPRYRGRFCSRACVLAKTRKPFPLCLNCHKPVKRRHCKFCCSRCAWLYRSPVSTRRSAKPAPVKK